MAPLLPRVVAELVGPIELAEFGGHLFMLAVYTVLFQLVSSLGLDKLAAKDYDLSCAVDALEYGSGLDSRRQRDPSGSDPNLPRATSGGDTAIEADAGASDTPWWRRPPPTWPPRVDAPTLVFGDVVACYSSGFVALTVMTSGRAAEWPSEGAAIACAWIVGAAVTNAWDPTAVLPSLGLANAVGCVARMAIDAASTRLALALVGAAVAQQRVDVQLLILEPRSTRRWWYGALYRRRWRRTLTLDERTTHNNRAFWRRAGVAISGSPRWSSSHKRSRFCNRKRKTSLAVTDKSAGAKITKQNDNERAYGAISLIS